MVMPRMGSISSVSIRAKASTIMDRRDVCHSSFCPNSTAPIRRMMEASFGSEGMIAIGPKECPNADDLYAALDFAVQAFDRVGRVQLCPVFLGEGHVSQHVVLGVIHQRGEFGHLGPDLIGDCPPLRAGRFGGVLSEGRGDEGRDYPAPALSGMGQSVALEVDPAPLPGRAQDLRDGGLDAFVGIADDQLHAP